jgi:hypothetical protein
MSHRQPVAARHLRDLKFDRKSPPDLTPTETLRVAVCNFAGDAMQLIDKAGSKIGCQQFR